MVTLSPPTIVPFSPDVILWLAPITTPLIVELILLYPAVKISLRPVVFALPLLAPDWILTTPSIVVEPVTDNDPVIWALPVYGKAAPPAEAAHSIPPLTFDVNTCADEPVILLESYNLTCRQM